MDSLQQCTTKSGFWICLHLSKNDRPQSLGNPTLPFSLSKTILTFHHRIAGTNSYDPTNVLALSLPFVDHRYWYWALPLCFCQLRFSGKKEDRRGGERLVDYITHLQHFMLIVRTVPFILGYVLRIVLHAIKAILEQTHSSYFMQTRMSNIVNTYILPCIALVKKCMI